MVLRVLLFPKKGNILTNGLLGFGCLFQFANLLSKGLHYITVTVAELFIKDSSELNLLYGGGGGGA